MNSVAESCHCHAFCLLLKIFTVSGRLQVIHWEDNITVQQIHVSRCCKCQYWPWVSPTWCPQLVSLTTCRDPLPCRDGRRWSGPEAVTRGWERARWHVRELGHETFPCHVGEHSLHHEVPLNSDNPSTAFSDSQLSGINRVIRPMKHEFIPSE